MSPMPWRRRPPNKAIPDFVKALERYTPHWKSNVLRVIEVRDDLDPKLVKMVACGALAWLPSR